MAFGLFLNSLWGVFFVAGFDVFNNHWDDGDEDDGDDDELEIFLDNRQIAKEVTCKGEEGCPDETAKDVVEDETAVIHGAYPCHKRGKGADNWHKAGQHNRFTTMFFIKSLGTFQILLFKETVILLKHFWANRMAYPVVGGIAQDSSSK